MNTRAYSIDGSWWEDDASPAIIGARFLDVLDRLGPLDPAMDNWLFVDTVSSTAVPIADARPKMTRFVERNVQTDDDNEPNPKDGYAVLASGAKVASEFGTPQTVHLTATVGSLRTNEISFRIGGDFGPPADLALVTYPIFRGALEILASTWPCSWLEAQLFAWNYPPLVAANSPDYKKPPKPTKDECQFPWILYLSAPFAAGLVPPADLVCERTPGGGLILSATTDRLDRDNPDHIRRSRMLQAIMADRVDSRRTPSGMGVGLKRRIGPY